MKAPEFVGTPDFEDPDMTAATPLLDSIKCPADLRGLHAKQLRQLADELRAETISAVAVTGGHLGAGQGSLASTHTQIAKPCRTASGCDWYTLPG